MLSEIFKGKFLTQNNILTFGEKYEDSMIGKTINYTSANNGSNIQTAGGWIILGNQINEQRKNDIIITTKIPVSLLTVEGSLSGW